MKRIQYINMDSFYVYIKGGYTPLAKPIHLVGKWEVALTQIHLDTNITPKHFGVLANIVDTSCVHDTTLPILRFVHSLKGEFTLPYYKPVTVNHLSYIDITLVNHDLTPISPDIKNLVLHFRKT